MHNLYFHGYWIFKNYSSQLPVSIVYLWYLLKYRISVYLFALLLIILFDLLLLIVLFLLAQLVNALVFQSMQNYLIDL